MHAFCVLADPARQAAQETVLAGLDRAFLDTSSLDLERARSFQESLHIVEKIEARLSANLAAAIYSDELASELRISVRTMHTAMLKIRGMSLHRYLRLRRLWALRTPLLAGGKTLQHKASAPSKCLLHLSELSPPY